LITSNIHVVEKADPAGDIQTPLLEFSPNDGSSIEGHLVPMLANLNVNPENYPKKNKNPNINTKTDRKLTPTMRDVDANWPPLHESNLEVERKIERGPYNNNDNNNNNDDDNREQWDIRTYLKRKKVVMVMVVDPTCQSRGRKQLFLHYRHLGLCWSALEDWCSVRTIQFLHETPSNDEAIPLGLPQPSQSQQRRSVLAALVSQHLAVVRVEVGVSAT